MSIGFWICVACSIINLVLGFRTKKDSLFVAHLITFFICGLCALGIYLNNYGEEHNTNIRTIENIKTVRIDTVYIIRHSITDTTYTITYVPND